jgi:molybdenum cofactor guanylyltransferase
LGSQKALEIVNGQILINRVIDKVSLISKEVIIVTSDENYTKFININNSVKIVKDIYPGKAALGAIYTGLINMESEYGLVVACDMPFLNTDLLNYMIRLSPDFDIVIPIITNLLEPLHGVYKKTCVNSINNLLSDGILYIVKLYELTKTRYIQENEIDKIDPSHWSFFNVNTKEDLDYANKIAMINDI